MKPKTTMITGVLPCVNFQPAKHTLPKSWDSNDTDIVIFLVLTLSSVLYFGYGLLN